MRRRRAGLLVVALVAAAAVAVAAAALLLRTATPSTAAPAPHFVDETAASGLTHRYEGDAEYQVGGGVAILDCDADGRQDVYLAGGSAPASLFRNRSEVGRPLRFERVAGPVTDLAAVNGAYPIDIDGDGFVDLAVLRSHDLVILRGLGGCTFEDATEALSLTGIGGQTTAFSAKWDWPDPFPTLAIGHYLTLDAEGERTFDCDDNVLVRSNPSNVTYAVYAPPIPLSPGLCTLSMLFSDWDRSGRRDLRVTNDRQYYLDGMDQLWRTSPDGPPRLYTADDGWVAMQIFGMGIASQDLTGDGLPEVYLTSQGDNKLQTLTVDASTPTFRDIALRRGVNAAQPYTGGDVLPSTAWHPEFADVNDDGFIDLFVSKGNIGEQATHASRDPSNLFIGQPDGTFREGAEAAGIVTFERGRGAALADLNLDGLLDLVVVNYGTDTGLWRNVGGGAAEAPSTMGHWVALDLRQATSNRDAIGAWLEIRIGDLTIHREITIGGGHAGGQLGWVHVGLGPATSAEVRVTWPDGYAGPWQRLEPDAFWIVERDVAPVRWSPEE